MQNIHSVINVKPKAYTVNNTVTQIYKVSSTQGVFGSSSLVYNESATSYNQAGVIYGGADVVQDIGPKTMKVQ